MKIKRKKMQLKHLAMCTIPGKDSMHHKHFYAVDDDDGDSGTNDDINSYFLFSRVTCPTLNR